MTDDEARVVVIEGINYAAYRETEHSLRDSDKNRLFWGSIFHRDNRCTKRIRGRERSSREDGDTSRLGQYSYSVCAQFAAAQLFLENEDSVIGPVIRLANERRNVNGVR